MLIAGIGVDIEDISRFRARPYNQNMGFYGKIFTPKEIRYCLAKPNPYQHFAARFCAKEAFVKAIMNDAVDYKSVEVVMEGSRPSIKWNKKTFFLSISHDKNKAIAFVVVGRR